MRTITRHGEEYTVLEGGVITPLFEVTVRDTEWFGGFLDINADDQTKMQFCVPIGYWRPLFGKLPAGFGSVPCGDLEQFKHFLHTIAITTGVKEAIVLEGVNRKDERGQWKKDMDWVELFRITHEWDWHDRDEVELCPICNEPDCEHSLEEQLAYSGKHLQRRLEVARR